MSVTGAATLAASFWIAVGLIFAANVLLPLQDAFSKGYVQDLPVWQVLLVRSLTVLAIAVAIGRGPVIRRARRARNLRWIVLRALMNLAAWGCFYLALRDIPLAQAITLYFFSPILVALMAGPFLGERVGLGQWAAIAAGFGGVALASGAASFEMSSASAFALLAAALWAGTMLMLRAFSGEEGALAQVVAANVVFVLVTGACALVWGWQADLSQTLGIAAAGVLGGAGQFAIYEAARRIPASTLAALEYGALVSGFGLGWLMFDEIPTAAVWGGAGLVLVSGVAVVGLERLRARAAPPLPLGPFAPAVALAAEAEAEADASLTPKNLTPPTRRSPMTQAIHDKVAKYISLTRYPFPGQQDWPEGYVAKCNAETPVRAIEGPEGTYYPDIIIVSPSDEVREIGEVEMTVDPARVPWLKACSLATDDNTPTKVRHFFVYVPAGLEAEAQALLEDNGISYAGVRGFTVDGDAIRVVPFVTKGDQYDHQITEPGTVR